FGPKRRNMFCHRWRPSVLPIWRILNLKRKWRSRRDWMCLPSKAVTCPSTGPVKIGGIRIVGRIAMARFEVESVAMVLSSFFLDLHSRERTFSPQQSFFVLQLRHEELVSA